MRPSTMTLLGGIVLMAFVGIGSLSAAQPKVTAELLAQGKTAYTTNCAACHGDKGDGNGVAGQALNPKPRDLHSTDMKVGSHYKNGGKPEQLFKSVTEGLPGTAMAPFGHLSESDRWAIVSYIQKEFQKGK